LRSLGWQSVLHPIAQRLRQIQQQNFSKPQRFSRTGFRRRIPCSTKNGRQPPPKLPPDANCQLRRLSKSWNQIASTINGFTVLKAVFHRRGSTRVELPRHELHRQGSPRSTGRKTQFSLAWSAVRTCTAGQVGNGFQADQSNPARPPGCARKEFIFPGRGSGGTIPLQQAQGAPSSRDLGRILQAIA